jgi:hypothetical protein
MIVHGSPDLAFASAFSRGFLILPMPHGGEELP